MMLRDDVFIKRFQFRFYSFYCDQILEENRSELFDTIDKIYLHTFNTKFLIKLIQGPSILKFQKKARI